MTSAYDADQAEHLLPLSAPVFQILLALADRERHGYAIMQEVLDRSDGKIRLGPGTLYGAIKRLLREGLIEETVDRPDSEIDDQRRRYYKISRWGHRVARAEAERLMDLVRVAAAKGLVTSAAFSPAR